ncbi:MAG TPA: hypothetical protein PL033_12835 [Candidatus Brocadiia bacterium]|nr:hypothetical protein [Candidatus Brocadiia bacterium]
MAGMFSSFRDLDQLLRGNATTPELLGKGTDHLKLGSNLTVVILLGIIYGVSMGLFGVLTHEPPINLQVLSSALKVPALFLLTLVVTFPSLYVFGALLGVDLSPAQILRALMAAIAVNLAVLASLAPITAFFTLTTTSYSFMTLLNVAFFALAGFVGIGFLLTVLQRIELARRTLVESRHGKPAEPKPAVADGVGIVEPDEVRDACAPPPSQPAREIGGSTWGADRGLDIRFPPPPTPRELRGRSAKRVFYAWLMLYCFVGAQMAWVLRPFIGAPGLPFGVFREREGNFLQSVLRSISNLLN